MQPSPQIPLQKSLSQAVSKMLRNPLRTLVPPWSWKAAACTATLRALAFFASNLQSGKTQATKAMLVEAVFAVFTGGLIGAVSQHLRFAKPLWATALLLCVALPGAMTIAQAGIHHMAGTPHQGAGLTTSFCLAGFAAAYTWFAMRRGSLLGGREQTSVQHDLRTMPRITLDFLLVLPRLLGASSKQPQGS